MAKFDNLPNAYRKIVPHLPIDNVFLSAVGAHLFLLLTLVSCPTASAQNGNPEYIRNSQPSLLTYRELLALSEQEAIAPALGAKLNTLLTTPFVNNEAYFGGMKPLRPDLNGTGPSLRLVQWNIERGLELDDIKLLMTDKKAFLAKVHSEVATGKDIKKPTDDELSKQMDSLQSADVIILNEPSRLQLPSRTSRDASGKTSRGRW